MSRGRQMFHARAVGWGDASGRTRSPGPMNLRTTTTRISSTFVVDAVAGLLSGWTTCANSGVSAIPTEIWSGGAFRR